MPLSRLTNVEAHTSECESSSSNECGDDVCMPRLDVSIGSASGQALLALA
jgi:hypothetical protein